MGLLGFASGEKLTLFDNLADKDFGETADDGQNRRRDGLLQDRVDELDEGRAFVERLRFGSVTYVESD